MSNTFTINPMMANDIHEKSISPIPIPIIKLSKESAIPSGSASIQDKSFEWSLSAFSGCA